jgi:hypothetical protein
VHLDSPRHLAAVDTDWHIKNGHAASIHRWIIWGGSPLSAHLTWPPPHTNTETRRLHAPPHAPPPHAYDPELQVLRICPPVQLEPGCSPSFVTAYIRVYIYIYTHTNFFPARSDHQGCHIYGFIHHMEHAYECMLTKAFDKKRLTLVCDGMLGTARTSSPHDPTTSCW